MAPSFVKLTLGDRTGTVPGVVCDGLTEFRELCHAGEVLGSLAGTRFIPVSEANSKLTESAPRTQTSTATRT